jgi:hypothetical protein
MPSPRRLITAAIREDSLSRLKYKAIKRLPAFAGRLSRLKPDHLFVKGDRTTVAKEALDWIRDPRAATVLPFVVSSGLPEGFLADRASSGGMLQIQRRPLSLLFISYGLLVVRSDLRGNSGNQAWSQPTNQFRLRFIQSREGK